MLQINISVSLKGPWSNSVRMTDGSKQNNNDSNNPSSFKAGEKYSGSMKFIPEHSGQCCGLLEMCLEQEKKADGIKRSILT